MNSVTPSYDELRNTVARMLEEPLSAINGDTSPETMPSWDSTRHLELILEIESAFGVQFEAEEVPMLDSVNRIWDRLQTK
jgi:acyl carrier protein